MVSSSAVAIVRVGAPYHRSDPPTECSRAPTIGGGIITDDQRWQAITAIHEKRAFCIHVTVYVVVNACVVGIWDVGGQGSFWRGWALAG
jgi:hypothetical protein